MKGAPPEERSCASLKESARRSGEAHAIFISLRGAFVSIAPSAPLPLSFFLSLHEAPRTVCPPSPALVPDSSRYKKDAVRSPVALNVFLRLVDRDRGEQREVNSAAGDRGMRVASVRMTGTRRGSPRLA